MLEEEWKDIEGWKGCYKISNLGRVLNVKRGTIKALDNSNIGGYLKVQLCNNNIRKKYFVHRLVAKAFVKGYFEGADVNHKDFNRKNNCFRNLEWVTKSQNSKWTYNFGRMTSVFKNKPYKILFSNGKEIRFDTLRECAKHIGICKSTLYNKIRQNKNYIKSLDCYIISCGSNDYPEMEYTQAGGNGGNNENC